MGGDPDVSVRTYYYYKVKLPHANVLPSEPILCYNAVGDLVFTVPAYTSWVDYANGIINAPGSEQNTTVESISTASYWVFYSSNDLVIDYDKVEFKVSKNLVRNPDQRTVQATFEYFTVVTAVSDIGAVIDGRWDTQVQTAFYAEPPSGYVYAIIDLGTTYNVQAVDVLAGFFKPTGEPNMKFDLDMRFTVKYSTDGVNYYDISDSMTNIKLAGGESKSFEESDLGAEFQCRYLSIVLEQIKKVEYRTGVWPVAFSEVSAYEDVVLKSEATLIRTTTLSSAVNITEGAGSGESYTINVVSTTGFASSGTAYIEEDMFVYTGTTATSFTGCSGLNSDHPSGHRVTASLDGDTTLYDTDGLLNKLGDRVYKIIKIDDNTLYTQEEADRISKAYLREFLKDHKKITVQCVYAPFIQVGHTVRLVDAYNGTATNYFVEGVRDIQGQYELVLAYYPAD